VCFSYAFGKPAIRGGWRTCSPASPEGARATAVALVPLASLSNDPRPASAMAGLLKFFQSFRTLSIIIANFPSTAESLDTGHVRVKLINQQCLLD
jgi:hypothetical protein